jgi:hypothetical protein
LNPKSRGNIVVWDPFEKTERGQPLAGLGIVQHGITNGQQIFALSCKLFQAVVFAMSSIDIGK